MSRRTVSAVCAGCGLLCDVEVQVEGNRIVGVKGSCAHAARWFGDGSTPDRILVNGNAAPFETAISTAAAILSDAHGAVAIHAGPGLTIEALRPVVALADQLEAAMETATSRSAAAGIVAGQRRGRAASTIGEVRNRADLVLLWGVSLESAPCLGPRLLDPPGSHVHGGRKDRRVIAVSIGKDGGAAGADQHVAIDPADELRTLVELRAAVVAPGSVDGSTGELGKQLAAARYVAIIADGEEGDARRPAQRAEALVALAQALNTPTRATLVTLRAGENRNGIEAILTWQTGYPFAVSFRSGVPRYAPESRADLPPGSTVLVAGDWRALGDAAQASLAGRDVVVVGPGASDAPFGPRVAIDTGRAGIHEGGTVYRTDDIPLQVVAVVDAARTAAMTLQALEQAVAETLRAAAT